MWYQAPLINAYVKAVRHSKPAHYRQVMLQLLICWAVPIALTLVDWRAALYALWIPRFASLYLIIYFNYGQHVHCDPYSKWNHSRSFTSPILNFLLFNNGFHSVHHMKTGTHWSLLPAMHARFGGNIHPALNVRSFWVWAFKQYVVAPFAPKYGTQQIGRAPFDPPPEFNEVEEIAANEQLVDEALATAHADSRLVSATQ
jgi:fatty acid desaturase